jgi:hypothetical protein
MSRAFIDTLHVDVHRKRGFAHVRSFTERSTNAVKTLDVHLPARRAPRDPSDAEQ